MRTWKWGKQQSVFKKRTLESRNYGNMELWNGIFKHTIYSQAICSLVYSKKLPQSLEALKTEKVVQSTKTDRQYSHQVYCERLKTTGVFRLIFKMHCRSGLFISTSCRVSYSWSTVRWSLTHLKGVISGLDKLFRPSHKIAGFVDVPSLFFQVQTRN